MTKTRIKFAGLVAGQRFWTNVGDHPDEQNVEHMRLYETAEDWNCVMVDHRWEGRLGYIQPDEDVLIAVPSSTHTGPQNVEYRYPNGDRLLVEGICITPSEQVDRFTVTVRSLSGIGAGQLRDLIQSRYKVDQIEHGTRTIYVADRR